MRPHRFNNTLVCTVLGMVVVGLSACGSVTATPPTATPDVQKQIAKAAYAATVATTLDAVHGASKFCPGTTHTDAQVHACMYGYFAAEVRFVASLRGISFPSAIQPDVDRLIDANTRSAGAEMALALTPHPTTDVADNEALRQASLDGTAAADALGAYFEFPRKSPGS